jgi:DNA-binding transcriptional ArsR family regulator
MSRSRTSQPTPKAKADPAIIFAALGDRTRLKLISRLKSGASHSIVELSADAVITRQAISKHLGALERAGLVRRVRRGREAFFSLEPAPLEQAQTYLAEIAAQWDEALARLSAHVEK